jgi:hypothetical protein
MSTNFHRNFPWGKSAWIWELHSCLGVNIPAIIQRCKDTGISSLIIKTGDGEKLFPDGNSQLTAEMVNQFHAAGIKVYSWSYCYGKNPVREAELVLYAIEQLHVDGHVIDAESEYEKLPNPAQAATTMMQTIRSKYPDFFVAHAPYPIIDYHQRFPYLEFGKYCDAVMPQSYFNQWRCTPQEAIIRTYQQFSKWEKVWKDGGYADSIKPIIPICSAYDDYVVNPPYTLKPSDLAEFITASSGYKAVSFWSFQHILRPDCWDAIKNNDVMHPTSEDLGSSASQNQTQPSNSAEAVQSPTTGGNIQNEQSSGSTQTPPSNQTTGADSGLPKSDTTTEKVLVEKVAIPNGATVVVKPDESAPHGVSVEVKHKVLLDFIIELFQWFFKRGGGK